MKTRRSPIRNGYSLLEILAVLTVIGLIAGLAIPAISSLVRGNQVTTSSQLIVSQLNLARQTALAANRMVEVRLYKFHDSNVSSSEDTFRAVQLFQYDETNTVAKPLGKALRLPGLVIMDSSGTYSTLLDESVRKKNWVPATDPQVNLPGANSYTACYLRFRSDGSTDLSRANQWFLTLRTINDTGTPAKNYITIQIDPVNGTVKTYRPG